MAKNISFSSDNYSFSQEDGKIKLSLGNMTTAGWYWSGDKSDLTGFLIRLKNSSVKDEFIADAKKNGLKFSDLKSQLKTNIKKGDGLYTITGDNRFWHFGEGDEPDFDSAYDDVERTPEEKKAIENAFYDEYETSFDEFKEMYGQEIQRSLIDAVEESSSYEEFFDALDERKEGIYESVREYQSNQEIIAFNNAVKKVSGNRKPSASASEDKSQTKIQDFKPSVGMSLSPPARSSVRRSTSRSGRRGSI